MGNKLWPCKGRPPNHGIKYPLFTESPPFLTWQEIERRQSRGISNGNVEDLWDCLYLSTQELEAYLDYIETNSIYGFLYPMSVMAAHTGARRSELCRSWQADIDFEGGTILIRERKRTRGKQFLPSRSPQ